MPGLVVDPDETCAIGHAGWGEGSNDVWRYDSKTGREEIFQLSGRPFHLLAGRSGEFVLVVELAPPEYRCSVRRIAEFESALASAVWVDGVWSFAGSDIAWSEVPRHVAVPDRHGRPHLLTIDPSVVGLDPLSWFWEGGYDLSWQGLHQPVEIPDRDLLIFPVQRDSRPVVYDPHRRHVVERIHLAARGGNPSLYFRRTAPELWADDYDTLVRLGVTWFAVLDVLELQPPYDGSRQFIGAFWFPVDERVCVVARPFSGDAVFIDPARFTVRATVALGQQPLEAVIVGDRVIARDWKSRSLLTADVHEV